jgi:hypothetical protein
MDATKLVERMQMVDEEYLAKIVRILFEVEVETITPHERIRLAQTYCELAQFEEEK